MDEKEAEWMRGEAVPSVSDSSEQATGRMWVNARSIALLVASNSFHDCSQQASYSFARLIVWRGDES